MKFFNQLVALVAVVAPALVTAWELDGNHQFKAPTGDDVRSPCPGLNMCVKHLSFTLHFGLISFSGCCSLANHGFLPRSGRNLTQDMVLEAIKGT